MSHGIRKCVHQHTYGGCRCVDREQHPVVRVPCEPDEFHLKLLAEYENAVTWETSCLGCSNRMDGLIEERAAGYRDAIEQVIDHRSFTTWWRHPGRTDTHDPPTRAQRSLVAVYLSDVLLGKHITSRTLRRIERRGGRATPPDRRST